MTCQHGFIGACAECDGAGQDPPAPDCTCGEWGGGDKTCAVHGYEGTDPDIRERARGRIS